MEKKYDIIVADPSGNITIMVLTPVDRNEYTQVAQMLLDNKKLKGEQVAFMLPDGSSEYPSMEMCGLEFCGNASRAFALYKAMQSEPMANEITVNVSGCNKPLKAVVDVQTGCVEMDMPIPTGFREFSAEELRLGKNGLLVTLDGIAHLILQDIPPMKETFEDLRHYIYETYDADMPAFGVMFYDTCNQMMTPVVYVKDVDTTYFEGSCASGTLAAAYAVGTTKEDGTHEFTMQQPGGVLNAKVVKKEGRIENIYLNGPITLSDIITIG